MAKIRLNQEREVLMGGEVVRTSRFKAAAQAGDIALRRGAEVPLVLAAEM